MLPGEDHDPAPGRISGTLRQQTVITDQFMLEPSHIRILGRQLDRLSLPLYLDDGIFRFLDSGLHMAVARGIAGARQISEKAPYLGGVVVTDRNQLSASLDRFLELFRLPPAL